MTAQRFRQDSDSQVHLPGLNGPAQARRAALAVQDLIAGLRDGASLCARQIADPPIVLWQTKDGQQVLQCQSSGSSGAPKTIQRRPESWISSFEITRDQFGAGADTPYAVLGDPGHSLVLFAILEAFHLGADLAVLAGLSPRSQLSEMAGAGTQILYATPAQLRLLLKVQTASLDDMQLVFSGGGKLDADTAEALGELFPNAKLCEFFGASETSFMTIAPSGTPIASVGRAYPGVQIDLRDTQGGSVGQGPGELWVKSPYLFDGYSDGDSPDTCWQDGWLTVGEMAQLDDDGFLYLLGRKSRMVTVADHNVFPEAVEAAILQLCKRRCSVVAVPDAARGQSLVAVVENAPSDALAVRIKDHCRIALGVPSTPRKVLFVEALPMLPAGKPDLPAIEHMAKGAS
ncbi:long-chain acyl-CoA synthetase [Aliiroseovarius halocynthiae]|uniref:Long-chain fatty acid--CoA ligase n=1 Tax=Aliiroseovarius halocynthiae TaxID=985055 RepID=A0A545SU80_9RHOB|nr:AMP-binding protein [Aliiroseovarius halocynthiae]TQV68514.1 long-chain fatty acid--CoA ligase [Aliiroseovarius halocynthiae]SMR70914.1 long-chain acyl-CoA synthetase [Aliiroseovarius halocynthiae]